MHSYEEDDGNDDGDSVGGPRAYYNAMQPWQQPPWHMWGNSQQLEAFGLNAPAVSQQLLKIAYGRPETWHWLFAIRIVSGPAGTPADTRVTVGFNLTTGIGRSSVTLANFETLVINWSLAAPVGRQVWSTSAVGPTRIFFEPPMVPPAGAVENLISEIVAQDIQLGVTVDFDHPAATAVVVDVDAYFAPKNHIRPDWFLPGPPTAKFPGSETGGR